MPTPRGSLPHRTLLRLGLAEFAGTALLLSLGVSVLIALDWAVRPWTEPLPGGVYLFGSLSGFAFGFSAMVVIVSRVGRASGGHINPVVTLILWFEGERRGSTALVYVVSQFAGAIAGTAPLMLWGARADSFRYAATVPDPDVPLWQPFAGETLATFLLLIALFLLRGQRVTGRPAFYVFPLLFAVLTPLSIMPGLQGFLTGFGANPARSLGPAVVADVYDHLWLYFLAPPVGGILALILARATGLTPRKPRRRSRVVAQAPAVTPTAPVAAVTPSAPPTVARTGGRHGPAAQLTDQIPLARLMHRCRSGGSPHRTGEGAAETDAVPTPSRRRVHCQDRTRPATAVTADIEDLQPGTNLSEGRPL
ncbi:MIP/aquaporin family protein [Streptomyces sp. NPDC087844]|uniref:MIP/aquaporin family protein n=1 Tax=Streptomyces sp. NPDC087844 TaxID=3365805 RepID=UPI00382D8B86